MRVTYKEKPEDPDYPIMHGNSPFAKEFNKREEKLRTDGKINRVDWEQIATVLLEILGDDYNTRYAPKKKGKKPNKADSVGEQVIKA